MRAGKRQDTNSRACEGFAWFETGESLMIGAGRRGRGDTGAPGGPGA